MRRLARSASSRAACSATSTSRSSYWRSRARSAARTVLTTAVTRIGRSSSVTLRKISSVASVRSSACDCGRRPRRAGAERRTRPAAAASVADSREARIASASSVSTTAPAPAPARRTAPDRRADVAGDGRAASRSRGQRRIAADRREDQHARVVMRSTDASFAQQRLRACRRRSARRSARRGNRSTPRRHARHPGRCFNSRIVDLVLAGPLLDDRNRPADGALRLEEPQQNQRSRPDSCKSIGVAIAVPMMPCCAITMMVATPRRRYDEQLVEPRQRRTALRDRVQVAVEAVDHDDPRAGGVSTASRTRWLNSPGDSSPGSTCWTDDVAGGDPLRHAHTQRVAAADEGFAPLVEQEDRRLGPAFCRRQRIARRASTCRTRGPDQERRTSPRSGRRRAADRARRRRCPAVRWAHVAADGRHQLGKHRPAAPADDEIVKTFDRRDAAVLDDADPAPRASVLERQLLEQNHAVSTGSGAAGRRLRRCCRRAAAPCNRGRRRTPSGRGSAAGTEADHARAAASRTASRRPRASAARARRLQHRLDGLTELHFRRVIQRVVVLRRLASPLPRAGTSRSHRATSRATPRPPAVHGSFPTASRRVSTRRAAGLPAETATRVWSCPCPGSPWTRYIRSAVRPPRSSSSRPGTPVETIDDIGPAGISRIPPCNGWAEYFYNRGVMRFPSIVRAGLGVVALAASSTLSVSAQQSSYAPAALTAADYARAEKFMGYNTTPLVLHSGVRPTWLGAGDDRFWYRVTTERGPEAVLVDPVAGTRDPRARCRRARRRARRRRARWAAAGRDAPNRGRRTARASPSSATGTSGCATSRPARRRS